jgi:hypothetical protein
MDPASPARPKAPNSKAKHEEANGHHNAETPEDDGDRWAALLRPLIKAAHHAVPVMLQDKGAEIGDLYLVVDAPFRLIRHAK